MWFVEDVSGFYTQNNYFYTIKCFLVISKCVVKNECERDRRIKIVNVLF